MTATDPSLPVVHIIDDDEAVRHSLSLSLQAAGFDVHEYWGSNEFLAAQLGNTDAILVVDQGLPNMSGLELLDRLAADGRSIPTVLISGDTLASSPESYRQDSIIACLEKPFRLSSLAELISDYVERRWVAEI